MSKLYDCKPTLVKSAVVHHSKSAENSARQQKRNVSRNYGCPQLDNRVPELEVDDDVERAVVDLPRAKAVCLAFLLQDGALAVVLKQVRVSGPMATAQAQVSDAPESPCHRT